MSFTANFNPTDFVAVKDNENTPGYFALEFGENASEGTFTWEGSYSVYVDAGEVNGARDMVITVSPSTVISYAQGATGSTGT